MNCWWGLLGSNYHGWEAHLHVYLNPKSLTRAQSSRRGTGTGGCRLAGTSHASNLHPSHRCLLPQLHLPLPEAPWGSIRCTGAWEASGVCPQRSLKWCKSRSPHKKNTPSLELNMFPKEPGTPVTRVQELQDMVGWILLAELTSKPCLHGFSLCQLLTAPVIPRLLPRLGSAQ